MISDSDTYYNRCKICGAFVGLPYRCSRCNELHCHDHRLPEYHNCNPVPEKPGYVEIPVIKKETEDTEKAQNIIERYLFDGLTYAFDYVIRNRRDHYLKGGKKPARTLVAHVIEKYALRNAAISVGINLLQGPWGMIAVTPEILIVTKNQASMIYDISVAYGKEELLNKEMLTIICLTSPCHGSLGLMTINGTEIVLKKASLRVSQKLVSLLAGNIAQRAIKSTISKWLPGIGPGLMSAYAYISTKKIGENAVEIFEKDIERYNDEKEE